MSLTKSTIPTPSNKEPVFFTKTPLIQFGFGIWTSLNEVAVNEVAVNEVAFGFSAVAIPQLHKSDTAIKITTAESAWIASVLTLFAPIGCVVKGYLLDRFGRRFSLIFCQMPMAAGWLYTGLANSAVHMIMGRIVTGIGIGFSLGPTRVYVTEISLPIMRGVLGARINVALATGVTMQDPPVCSKTSSIQIFYGLWVNLAEIGIGLAIGFSAVAVPQLKQSDKFVASMSELALIASVVTLSSPLGCLTCGLFIDKIGRRIMKVISQLPMAIGWWYTALSTSPKHFIIGRVITGIGVGMSSGPIRIYTTEISLPNMRGVLGAFPNTAISIGITATASMGATLHWTTHCYICGLFATFLMMIYYFLPETPYHVLMKDTTENYDNTRRALKKFRSKTFNVDDEMNELIDYKNENEIRRISLLQKIKALFHVSAYKPFLLVMPYILAGQGCGTSIMMFWTLDILEASNLGLDVYLCNIGLGVTRIFSGLITSILLYYFGRRTLALISGVGVSIVCFSVAAHLIGASSPVWYPLLGYMFYMFFASLGFYTLPLLIMFELYPLLLRGFLGGITVSLANLFIFASNQIYPIMKESIGLPNTFVIFGTFALLGTIFLYMFLPETKGLTLQEIEEYFNNKRPTLVSQRSADWQSRSQQFYKTSITSVKKSKSLEHHKASTTHMNPYSERKVSIKFKKDILNAENITESDNSTDVNKITKEARKNASSARVTIDPSTSGSLVTSGRVYPVTSTNRSEKSVETTNKESNLAATRRQDSKRAHSSSDSNDRDSNKK